MADHLLSKSSLPTFPHERDERYASFPGTKRPRELTMDDKDRIVEMALEDRTPFDAIFYQFGLRESEVRELMKAELRFSSYRRWRGRVEACATKHLEKRSSEIKRFRSSRQRAISQNKISKRR